MKIRNKKISVIGQGYVGLPLTIEIGKKYQNVIGFDNSLERIHEINKKFDHNKEISNNKFKKVKNITISSRILIS